VGDFLLVCCGGIILIFMLIVSSLVVDSGQLLAQNYEAVAPGRLSLFDNGRDIRGIEIENQTIGSNGEVIRENYPSVGFDAQGNALKNGNSWLGSAVISHDGFNIFMLVRKVATR
jgi:hypothetical protein